MKRRNKLIAAIIAVNMVTAMRISPIIVQAEGNYEAASNLVSTAISESNFYYYNMAYAEIMKLAEGKEKEELLSKLAAISRTVWTKDITEIVQLFETMAKEKSGRKYDALQLRIENSDIKEIDKQYLFSELSGWGRDTVWTDDYKKAIAATVRVWQDKTYTASRAAESSIRDLKLTVNKEYITELLNEAKTAVGLAPVVLTEKDFAAVTNSTYVGQGKSISVDLSKDTTLRTVILKGKFEDLYINAPKGTVILEDVVAANVNLLDVAGRTLLMRGNTKVQELISEDKDDNANIVMEGNATVASAEIRSGATLEVNTDKSVEKPFGELKLNLQEKKADEGEQKEEKGQIKLLGDFKQSSVDIQKPVDLKIEAVVGKISVTENAKDANINVSEKGSIQEIKTKAAVKVEGTGKIEKVTVEKAVELKIETAVTKIEISKEAKDTVVSISKEGKVQEFKAEAPVKVDGEGTIEKVTGSAGSQVVTDLPTIPPVIPTTTPPTTPSTGNGGGSSPDEDREEPAPVQYTISIYHDNIPVVPQIPLLESTKLKDLYSMATILLPNNKVESILTKLEDIQLDGGQGNLLTYIADILEDKSGFEELAGYLQASNAAAINTYLRNNNYTDLYTAVIAATDGSVTIPDLGGTLQIDIDGVNDLNITDTTNNTLDLNVIKAALAINENTTLGQLRNKVFTINISYAGKTYNATANAGTITFTTHSSGQYKIVIN